MTRLTQRELKKFIARAPLRILKNSANHIDLVYPGGKELQDEQFDFIESWAKGLKAIGLFSRFRVCSDALVIVKEAA